MLELAAIAIDLLAGPAKRIRKSAGGYVDGRWAEGAPFTTDIVACIQPVTPNDLAQLPEGERTEASVAIWSRTEIRTASVDNQTEADLIEDSDGVRYKVIRVFSRKEGGYTKAIGGRVK
jgi:hypothetical protein